MKLTTSFDASKQIITNNNKLNSREPRRQAIQIKSTTFYVKKTIYWYTPKRNSAWKIPSAKIECSFESNLEAIPFQG